MVMMGEKGLVALQVQPLSLIAKQWCEIIFNT